MKGSFFRQLTHLLAEKHRRENTARANVLSVKAYRSELNRDTESPVLLNKIKESVPKSPSLEPTKSFVPNINLPTSAIYALLAKVNEQVSSGEQQQAQTVYDPVVNEELSTLHTANPREYRFNRRQLLHAAAQTE